MDEEFKDPWIGEGRLGVGSVVPGESAEEVPEGGRGGGTGDVEVGDEVELDNARVGIDDDGVSSEVDGGFECEVDSDARGTELMLGKGLDMARGGGVVGGEGSPPPSKVWLPGDEDDDLPSEIFNIAFSPPWCSASTPLTTSICRSWHSIVSLRFFTAIIVSGCSFPSTLIRTSTTSPSSTFASSNRPIHLKVAPRFAIAHTVSGCSFPSLARLISNTPRSITSASPYLCSRLSVEASIAFAQSTSLCSASNTALLFSNTVRSSPSES